MVVGDFVFIGLVVISPAGRMFFMVIATICAGISTLLSRGITRTIGIVVTIVMLFWLASRIQGIRSTWLFIWSRQNSRIATKVFFTRNCLYNFCLSTIG